MPSKGNCHIKYKQYIYICKLELILFNNNIKNDDHYAAFNSVHNTEISECHRPSLVTALESAKRVPKGLLVNTKVRTYVECF